MTDSPLDIDEADERALAAEAGLVEERLDEVKDRIHARRCRLKLHLSYPTRNHRTRFVRYSYGASRVSHTVATCFAAGFVR